MLVAQPSRSATAKEIERQLRRFLANAWPRERERGAPDGAASPLRQAFWRIAYLTDGEGLAWRTIYDLIENAKE